MTHRAAIGRQPCGHRPRSRKRHIGTGKGSTLGGRIGDDLRLNGPVAVSSRTRSATPRTVGKATRRSGWVAFSRRITSPKTGASRETSDGAILATPAKAAPCRDAPRARFPWQVVQTPPDDPRNRRSCLQPSYRAARTAEGPAHGRRPAPFSPPAPAASAPDRWRDIVDHPETLAAQP